MAGRRAESSCLVVLGSDSRSRDTVTRPVQDLTVAGAALQEIEIDTVNDPVIGSMQA